MTIPNGYGAPKTKACNSQKANRNANHHSYIDSYWCIEVSLFVLVQSFLQILVHVIKHAGDFARRTVLTVPGLTIPVVRINL